MDAQTAEVFDTFILGEDKRCHVSTDCFKTQLNNNIMVAGTSGSGKTRGVMLPILLHLAHSNAVGIFSKWGMLSSVKSLLEERGYAVHVLNLTEPDKSVYSFDPLAYCKTDEDLRDLAHAIIYSSQTEGRDPYWEMSAENILYVALWVVKNYATEGNATIKMALQLLDRLVWTSELPDENEDWEPCERELYPAHLILDKFSRNNPGVWNAWRSYVKLPDATGACVTSSMQTPLHAVFPTSIRGIINNGKQFEFEELTKPKTVLFVYVSPVNVANHRYATLFYRQIFKTLFEVAESKPGHVLPHPVHILCDDFATGGRVPDFDHYIAIFREKRISATLLVQSESQLSSIYGKTKAKTIINNCDTYVFLGGMDDETIASIAKKTDVPESEVRDMPIGTEYFIRRGQKAIFTKRYDLFNDPVYLAEIEGKDRDEDEEVAPSPAESNKQMTSDELFSCFGITFPKQEEQCKQWNPRGPEFVLGDIKEMPFDLLEMIE